MRSDCAARALTRDQGSVALEAALVTPLFLLVILGGFYFGQGYSIRTQLTQEVQMMARRAALQENPASYPKRDMLSGFEAMCPIRRFEVSTRPLSGVTDGQEIVVEVDCAYQGFFGFTLDPVNQMGKVAGGGDVQEMSGPVINVTAAVPYVLEVQ